MDHTPYLIFLFFTLTIAAQTTGSVNCQTGYLPYPFGFTDGYPIRFNCSEKTDEAAIGEFAVAEVTNANIYVKIPPLCKRDIRKIEQLFRRNFAPSISQNTILVQGCNESSSDCSIGRSFVQDRLNLSSCISQVRCLDAATEIKADVMSVVDVVNRSGCSIGGLRKAVVAPLAPRTQVVRQSISAAVVLVIVAPVTMDFTATPSSCTVVADQSRCSFIFL
ncbi:hypothetical protein F2Q70_00031197 [Brassica cretica]|uniref:Wall-associated receptor kinase galacturonan-binding domain-containing protein n=1 Tax=Brassica cretica TaxID=69181 RepID=A0A8S9FRC2_BRACR|nr:hypothetical protein F2Q70_00031197 [Brassica cretica]